MKTKTQTGLSRFLQQEYKKQTSEHGYSEDISWWAKLAGAQAEQFVALYENDKSIPLTACTSAERNIRVEVPLPSGRSITMNCYLDAEGDGFIFEGKCRGDWDCDKIMESIHLDLQYNYYLFAYYSESGILPKKVWYQHSRRPGGFAYRGPRQKKSETRDEYQERVKQHMQENPDYYFFRFITRPQLTEVQKFTHACLYPVLEAFLDWYTYVTGPYLKGEPNHCHWMTPYGLYNPFLEGYGERYRNYRLTGSTIGLRQKPHSPR